MGKHSLDAEFSKYWARLTAIQKQAIQTFILSFHEEKKEISQTDINELNEPGAEYDVPWKIFKPLSKQQKKALITFLESSGIEPEGGISIEEYNKEIDEAMARMDAGEGIPHEEVVRRLKMRFSGK